MIEDKIIIQTRIEKLKELRDQLVKEVKEIQQLFILKNSLLISTNGGLVELENLLKEDEK